MTGEILDDKQEHLHAFAMIRESIAWLDRVLPLSARFPGGSIYREDRQPVPIEALRETIMNAVMHRDYSRAGSYVAIAVFDDRIEVRSVGEFPTGIRAEMLSGEHPSILRNPLIAGAFHRTGAVEVWGRGRDQARDQVGTKSGPSRDQVQALEKAQEPVSIQELMRMTGRTNRTKFRDQVIRPLLDAGLLQMTQPGRPRSASQRYRTTELGLKLLLRTGREH